MHAGIMHFVSYFLHKNPSSFCFNCFLIPKISRPAELLASMMVETSVLARLLSTAQQELCIMSGSGYRFMIYLIRLWRWLFYNVSYQSDWFCSSCFHNTFFRSLQLAGWVERFQKRLVLLGSFLFRDQRHLWNQPINRWEWRCNRATRKSFHWKVVDMLRGAVWSPRLVLLMTVSWLD